MFRLVRAAQLSWAAHADTATSTADTCWCLLRIGAWGLGLGASNGGWRLYRRVCDRLPCQHCSLVLWHIHRRGVQTADGGGGRQRDMYMHMYMCMCLVCMGAYWGSACVCTQWVRHSHVSNKVVCLINDEIIIESCAPLAIIPELAATFTCFVCIYLPVSPSITITPMQLFRPSGPRRGARRLLSFAAALLCGTLPPRALQAGCRASVARHPPNTWPRMIARKRRWLLSILRKNR